MNALTKKTFRDLYLDSARRNEESAHYWFRLAAETLAKDEATATFAHALAVEREQWAAADHAKARQFTEIDLNERQNEIVAAAAEHPAQTLAA